MSRQNNFLSLCALVASLSSMGVSAAQAQSAPQTISAVDVDGAGDSAFVRVRGWKDPTYTVFRLDQPDRVIVDLRNGDVSALAKKGPIPGKGPVLSVTVRHISDDKATVARLVISVKPDAKYDVRNEGTDLVVELHGGASASAVAQLASTPTPVVTQTRTAPVASAQPPAPVAAARPESPAAASPAAAPQDKNVVRVEVDRLPDGETGGSRLTEVKLAAHGGRAILELKGDGPVASYQLIELKEPGRVALDLEGFTHAVRPKITSAGPVTDVRVARREGAVRVVLESNGDHFPPFAITRTRNGLMVSVESERPAVVAEPLTVPKTEPTKSAVAVVTTTPATVPAPAHTATVAPVSGPAPTRVAKSDDKTPSPAPAAEPAHLATNRPVQIVSVDVSGQGRMSRVILAMTGDVQYEEQPQADGTRMLVLKNARISKELVRRLDASALEGPVYSVASYPQGDTVRLLAALRASETEAVSEINLIHMKDSYGLEWRFNGVAPRHLLAANAPVQSPRLSGLGGFAGEAASYAQTAAPRAAPGDIGRAPSFKEYEGKRVDFTAKDLDIVQFLQAISEIGHINIVASDDVAGHVSIRLRNVPWEEALDIVLKTKGFTKQRVSQNIIRVLPMKTYNEELAAEAARRELDVSLAPTRVRLIPVNFAPANEVADQVRDLLTPKRGSLSIDSRTNVLIIKDTEDVLKRAELLVRNLDTQTPEVLIEARIVEASTTFSHAAGIQWGGNVQAAPGTGNPTGLVFPNILSIAGAADDPAAPTGGTATIPNFAVNMPTSVGVGTGGGIGFIFGSAGGAANLNLRLTAAEQTGTLKTVSAPKAITLDHTAATISQGVSIPFSQVSAAGASTAFVEARLALSVTPHVTADGSVLMKLTVTNNQPNGSVTGSNGQPSITRKEATTTVIVKDGDTTVIGGIYTRQTSQTTNKVPWLAEIPILGAIFKQSSELDDRTEMLIFVSPKIINRQQSLAQAGDLGQ